MRTLSFKITFLALPFLVSCGPQGEDMPRQEVINSLRMLGVQAENVAYEVPASPLSNTVANISVFAASTKDLDVNMETWTPDGRISDALLAPKTYVSFVSSTMTKEKQGALYIHTGHIQVKIPAQALWAKFPGGGGKLAFGIKLFSAKETEYGVGNILAFPAGAAELSWQPPSLELTEPTTFTATINKSIDLSLKSDPPQNEALLFGWFVSSGQIAGRREKETSWMPDIKGTQTLIATVRGRESLAFAWKIFTVEVK